MINADDWILRALRGTRSSAPGKAANDSERKATYGAALQQFEELLDASMSVGPAARPLTLFYALSQGGRAIVAARGESLHVAGHGLKEDRTVESSAELLRRRIERIPSKDGRDAFGAVARATDSPDISGRVELGAVWSATPSTHRLPDAQHDRDWAVALDVLEDARSAVNESDVGVQLMCFSGPPQARDEASVRRTFAKYPTLPKATKVGMKSVADDAEPSPRDWIANASWPMEPSGSLDAVAPKQALGQDDRRVIPILPGQTYPLEPLMLWWLLLFGLSIFARYHPGLWAAALHVDNSELAVPLEAVLDRATGLLPRLVYEPLMDA